MYKFLFVLSIFCLACVPSKNLPESVSIDREESNGENILFVMYMINQTDDTPTAKMDNAIINAGILKEDMKSTSESTEDDIFILEAQDENKNLVKTFYLANPLIERIEYVKDDEGNMAVEEIKHEQKELIARLNITSNCSSLQLYYKESNTSKKKLLHAININ